MTELDFKNLITNKIIHERARLLILSYLVGSDTGQATFMELQKAMELTRGNLSIQLKTLQKAEYVRITKKFKDNKPRTTVHVTETGRMAIGQYLKEVEQVLQNLK
jgi:DNA-binding MarR family transcriptional regulator